MNYVISDIHGCYDAYCRLLKKIHFSDEDMLYVLGDAVDRGPEPIRLLQDLMMRPNVIFILGNHEYMMLQVLSRLAVEVTEENAEQHLTAEDMMNFTYWMQDGGGTTCEQFRKLSADQQQEILEYLQDASLYEEVETGTCRYVLVHAGIARFEEEKPLEDYALGDFLFHRADYRRTYFSDSGKYGSTKTYLVTGHTPTMAIREDGQPLVYSGHGHLAVDCGCVFGGRLAALCLEDGSTYYVEQAEVK